VSSHDSGEVGYVVCCFERMVRSDQYAKVREVKGEEEEKDACMLI
jgi:hypothetical protein